MITGEQSREYDAPVEEVWAVIGDVEHHKDWMSVVKAADIRERDAEGRPLVIDSENDAKVKTVKVTLRYTYEEGRMVGWKAEKGDLKAMDGSFVLEDAGGGRSRVTYAMAVDPGRKLGMIMRGPVVDQVRDRVLKGTLDDLQKRLDA